MFTVELARDVGIAYALYCLDCRDKGKKAMEALDFAQFVSDKIEEIKVAKGLVREDNACG